VEEVEKRDSLCLLEPFLEGLVSMGNKEPATHNAIGKIYITEHKEPQQFLQSNMYYDSKVVGKFCEKVDPQLAFLACQRANGDCDEELVAVCQGNGLFKELAKYLVTSMNMELWESVLMVAEGAEETPALHTLIDEVVQTTVPESVNPDEVSTTVAAFMNADLTGALTELLGGIQMNADEEKYYRSTRTVPNMVILVAKRARESREIVAVLASMTAIAEAKDRAAVVLAANQDADTVAYDKTVAMFAQEVKEKDGRIKRLAGAFLLECHLLLDCVSVL
jgi:clathrin heavy chain